MANQAYFVQREWYVDPGVVVVVNLPCSERGCVQLTRDQVTAIRQYVDILEQEVALIEQLRAPRPASVEATETKP